MWGLRSCCVGVVFLLSISERPSTRSKYETSELELADKALSAPDSSAPTCVTEDMCYQVWPTTRAESRACEVVRDEPAQTFEQPFQVVAASEKNNADMVEFFGTPDMKEKLKRLQRELNDMLAEPVTGFGAFPLRTQNQKGKGLAKKFNEENFPNGPFEVIFYSIPLECGSQGSATAGYRREDNWHHIMIGNRGVSAKLPFLERSPKYNRYCCGTEDKTKFKVKYNIGKGCLTGMFGWEWRTTHKVELNFADYCGSTSVNDAPAPDAMAADHVPWGKRDP